jgi:hypothetical protein
MGLQDVIRVQMSRFDSDSTGFTTSVVYRRYDNALDAFVWVVDVDLDTAPDNPNAAALPGLVAVPIDDPTRETFGADIGTQVNLQRRRTDQRYVVTGLSKYAAGTLSVCLVTLDPCGTTLTGIGNPVIFGNTVRLLTYTELGDPLLNGGFKYGDLPYGTAGKFDVSNNLLSLITP